jgi:type IV secretory pathway VirB6-like protein
MRNYVLETILVFAGFLLIFICLSEDFQQWCQRLQAALRRRPRWRLLAYPVVALVFMGAAALIIQALMIFAALRFSYD